MATRANSAQTRERILDCATGIFALKGWEATNLQDIADALEVTRGPIYYHFKDKQALYDETLRRLLERHERASLEILSRDEDIFARIICLLERWVEHRQTGSYVNDLVSNPRLAESRKLYTRSCERTYDFMVRRVREEIEQGRLRPAVDPVAFVESVYIFFNGLVCMVRSPVSSRCKSDPASAIAGFVGQLRGFYAVP